MTEILKAFTFLLGFQFLGTAAVMGLGVPIPGPVAGLLFLIGWRGMNAPRPKLLKETAQGLIAHLSLLFVPAAVGIVQHLDRLALEGKILLTAVVVSTILALIVGALTFVVMVRVTGALPEGEELRS